LFKTLNQIKQEQRKNDPVILGCYKNAIPPNVNYAIKYSQLNDLDRAIKKETEMEEFMLETNVDPEFILGKVQRQMNIMSISHQGPYTSRNVENQGTHGGIFQGIPPNVRKDPVSTQETR
jgi:hypothetical protein